MDVGSERNGASLRGCGIADKLGYRVICPKDGCALLRALGEQRPTDDRVSCPVEELAAGGNALVLRTLDALRRELERHSLHERARRAERSRALRHADTLRRWP